MRVGGDLCDLCGTICWERCVEIAGPVIFPLVGYLVVRLFELFGREGHVKMLRTFITWPLGPDERPTEGGIRCFV